MYLLGITMARHWGYRNKPNSHSSSQNMFPGTEQMLSKQRSLLVIIILEAFIIPHNA